MKSLNNCFVSVDKAVQDEIILGNGIKLYIAAEYNHEWNTTVTGTVESVPPALRHKINPKDKIFFSFRVVADRKAISEDEIFYKVSHDDDKYNLQYISNKGNKVVCVGFMGKISVIWTGYYWDRVKGFQHGFSKGSHGQMERWLAQFNMNAEVKYVYNNLYDIDGKDYWKVKPQEVFAKLEGEEIVPVGGRLILEPIDLELTEDELKRNGIFVSTKTDVKLRLYDRAKMLHDFEPLELKKGDTVGFDQTYVEKYELNGKQLFLIKPKRLTGVWQEV